MKAAYCGSFDPVTLGHLNIIERASRMFDSLTVIILQNSEKSGYFPVQQRLEWLQQATCHISNVECIHAQGLSVDICRKLQISVLVRGIRSSIDLEYEQNIASMNHLLAPEIETAVLLCRPEFAFCSSSNVRELLKYHQNIDALVPACVAACLKEKHDENIC